MANENEQQILEGQMANEALNREIASEEFAEEAVSQEIGQEAALAEQDESEMEEQLFQEQESFRDQQLANKIYEFGMSFGNPSIVKWGIIFILALINDGIDLLSLSGIGEIIAWLVSMGLTVTILLILWFTDSKVKQANQFLADYGQPQITNPGRNKLRGELTRKRLTGASSLRSKYQDIQARLGTRYTAQEISGFNVIKTLRNPMVLALAGGGFESIPFLGDINLIIVWMMLSYFDELRGFRKVREITQEVYGQTSSQIA